MEPLLTVKDVAAFLKVNPMTVYRAIETGELAHVRVGRSIRVTQEALNDYLKRPAKPEPPKTITRAPVTRL